MPRLTSVSLLLLALISTGCANRSLSAHQCQAGDWESVGYRDGMNGLSQSQLLEHQNACGRHNIFPDADSYRVGWNQGVREFCQPERGYDLGRAGGKFRPVCPSQLRASYRDAYDDGRTLYLAHRDVQRLESQISRAEARIDAIGGELIDVATAQVNPDLTTQERLDLLADSKALMDERDRLTESLPELAVELDRAHAHLDQVQQTLAYR